MERVGATYGNQQQQEINQHQPAGTAFPRTEHPDAKEGKDKGDTTSGSQRWRVVTFKNSATRLKCCTRFWRFIYYHGSIIGPAPCSFLFLCSCSSSCSEKSLGPLKKSSSATRLMYVMFLGVVSLFATFFIIVYPQSENHRGVAGLKPCVKPDGSFYEIEGFYRDCRGHAGYFIVYRIFLAINIMFVFLVFCTIGVKTSKGTCRPGLHQGFWLYKILIFFALTMVTILFISLKYNALFDNTMMIIGLLATVLFSIPQLILLLDMVEILIIKINTSITTPWRAKALCWTVTGFVYIVDLCVLAHLGVNYTHRFTGTFDETEMGPPVRYGSGDFCETNLYLLCYCCMVGIIVTVAMIFQSLSNIKTYPNLGLMQSAFVFGFSVSYVYSALGNSVDLECRIVSFPFEYNVNSQDEPFTAEGLMHAVFVWIAIIYFSLGNPPVSKTAPLSTTALIIFCKNRIKHKINEPSDGFPLTYTESQLNASEEKKMFLILKDEVYHLQYSWPLFHIFLSMGSLSLMMGMTNFMHPRADGPNTSNNVAFLCKLIISAMIFLGFLIPVVTSWVKHWTSVQEALKRNEKVLTCESRYEVGPEDDGDLNVILSHRLSSDIDGSETNSREILNIKSSTIVERNKSLELETTTDSSKTNISRQHVSAVNIV